MTDDHLETLRILISQAEKTDDNTQRAAALAEVQRVGAVALRDAVSRARDRGVPWRTLAGELRMAAATLHHQFTSGRALLPRSEQPSPRPHVPMSFADEFIGRQRELADLRRLLTRARVVTLTGAGGMGKTRLAGEFVRRTNDAFNAVWWVELAPFSDESLVDTAVDAALDRREGACVGLLVLDNCEHLTDACARLVPRLLAEHDGLRVLATSREQLGTTGEHVYAVPPLPANPAMRLFTERARAVADGFELTDDLATVVADLCARLDGLPLAIELAARQVAVLPPAELVACLDERLTLLEGGPRTAPARHQSLLAAIRWSYDLLSTVEQAAFRRLTIFPDSFERHDAAAVCSDLGLSDRTLWTVLTALVAKSLIVADGQRLRVLESLRVLGHAELTQRDEWSSTADRLVDRLLLFGLQQPLDGMTRDERRIKRGLHRHNIEYAVTLATPTDDERYAHLLATLARARRQCMAYHGCRELLENALARQRSATGRAVLLVELCDTMVNNGDYTSARDVGEQAVELARECGTPWLEHWAVQSLTFASGRLGDQAAMNSLLPQFVSSARALELPSTLAEALSHLAWNLLLRGLLDDAEAAVEEGLSLLNGDTTAAVLADLMHTAGAIALQRADADRAAAHFTVALTVGSEIARVDALEGLGLVAALHGQPDRAVRLLAAGRAMREKSGSVGEPWWSGLCSSALSTTHAELSPSLADTLVAEGASLTPDQAIACALDDSTSPSVLTPREWEVAGLVADGLTNREIAVRQGVSARTVASHLENIRAKLDVPTRAHITAWVTRTRIESSH